MCWAKIAHCQAFFVKDYGTVLRGNHATTDVILLALFVYHVLLQSLYKNHLWNVYHFRYYTMSLDSIDYINYQ